MIRIATTAGVVMLLLAGCGGSRGRSELPENVPDSLRGKLETLRCGQPIYRFGVGPDTGTCVDIERVVKLEPHKWLVEVRLPPVYCVELITDRPPANDGYQDRAGVGHVEPVACPASAYPPEPGPEIRLALLDQERRSKRGTVSLRSINNGQSTRVIVEADEMEWALIATGTCRQYWRTPKREFQLSFFYSSRSVTNAPVPLRSLLRTPHAVFIVPNGSYWPAACATLPVR